MSTVLVGGARAPLCVTIFSNRHENVSGEQEVEGGAEAASARSTRPPLPGAQEDNTDYAQRFDYNPTHIRTPAHIATTPDSFLSRL